MTSCLLAAGLRPGDIDAAKHARALLKLPVGTHRTARPGVEVIVRGDGRARRRGLMRRYDTHDVGRVPRPAKGPAPQRAAIAA
jgi:hypothetical protein